MMNHQISGTIIFLGTMFSPESKYHEDINVIWRYRIELTICLFGLFKNWVNVLQTCYCNGDHDITSVASDTSALRPIVPRKSKSLKLNDGRHVVGKTLLNRRSVGCFGFVFALGDPQVTIGFNTKIVQWLGWFGGTPILGKPHLTILLGDINRSDQPGRWGWDNSWSKETRPLCSCRRYWDWMALD
jgi:hypothetical protein